jgi:hypothetical protein
MFQQIKAGCSTGRDARSFSLKSTITKKPDGAATVEKLS